MSAHESDDTGRDPPPPPQPAGKAREDQSDTTGLIALEPLKEKIETALRPFVQRQSREQEFAPTVERVLKLVQQEIFHGPLPHPAHFERYEMVSPGSANRIIGMAEAEQAHRHTWENTALKYEFLYSIIGMICGAIIGIGFIIGGVVVAISGHAIVGSVLAGVSAVGMVAKFIHGRDIFGKDQSSDKTEKPKKTRNSASAPSGSAPAKRGRPPRAK